MWDLIVYVPDHCLSFDVFLIMEKFDLIYNKLHVISGIN